MVFQMKAKLTLLSNPLFYRTLSHWKAFYFILDVSLSNDKVKPCRYSNNESVKAITKCDDSWNLQYLLSLRVSERIMKFSEKKYKTDCNSRQRMVGHCMDTKMVGEKLALVQIHELQFAKDSTKTPYLKAWVRWSLPSRNHRESPTLQEGVHSTKI